MDRVILSGDFLCYSNSLVNAGLGYRFRVREESTVLPAFPIRFDDSVAAYLNICGHQNLELDWDLGNFFNFEHKWIICATHGALFSPSTGSCVGGPCNGVSLVSLKTDESNGMIFLCDERYKLENS
mgnify:CR=1 FL=1